MSLLARPVRIAELRPWRCHVAEMGVGEVIAREMRGAEISLYCVRIGSGELWWCAPHQVRWAAASVVAFPSGRAVDRFASAPA